MAKEIVANTNPGLSNVLKTIENLRNNSWQKQSYAPRDALVFKTETDIIIAPYSGQEYDPSKAELKEGYWDHDYCEICSVLLFQSDDPKHGTGYTDNNVWVCTGCHDTLLNPE